MEVYLDEEGLKRWRVRVLVVDSFQVESDKEGLKLKLVISNKYPVGGGGCWGGCCGWKIGWGGKKTIKSTYVGEGMN